MNKEGKMDGKREKTDGTMEGRVRREIGLQGAKAATELAEKIVQEAIACGYGASETALIGLQIARAAMGGVLTAAPGGEEAVKRCELSDGLIARHYARTFAFLQVISDRPETEEGRHVEGVLRVLGLLCYMAGYVLVGIGEE